MAPVMIGGDYFRVMARNNAWQNSQLLDILDAMPVGELTRDRGAFFGSILGRLNHVLWGDNLWMSRFYGGPAPGVGGADGPAMHADLQGWGQALAEMASRISGWASGLKLDLCVASFFNHQTHHRGQVHAMLTAAGSKAPVSDLFLMPEESPWL
ncbi:MAG: putative damage-inducible protein DinB [Paracoccaceae bacterium]|jgi:uncharacterized damage-inducible protein DinB